MAALTGAEDIQVQVLAVTHSPLLLASLEPLFDPAQDALWTIDVVNNAVELRREAWRRRGDANAWLISDVFDLGEPRSLEAEQAIRRAEALMRRNDVGAAEYGAVREELLGNLPDVDPFLVRWRFWATQTGLEK